MKCWTTPRKKLLEIAVDLIVNRGYSADGVTDTMVHGHFYGVDRQSACRRFSKDLEPLVADGIRRKTDAYLDDLRTKEQQLIAEGWRWVGYRGEGFFVHDETGYEVNKGGGVYANKERAILAVWNSVSRQSVIARQARQETSHE